MWIRDGELHSIISNTDQIREILDNYITQALVLTIDFFINLLKLKSYKMCLIREDKFVVKRHYSS